MKTRNIKDRFESEIKEKIYKDKPKIGFPNHATNIINIVQTSLLVRFRKSAIGTLGDDLQLINLYIKSNTFGRIKDLIKKYISP